MTAGLTETECELRQLRADVARYRHAHDLLREENARLNEARQKDHDELQRLSQAHQTLRKDFRTLRDNFDGACLGLEAREALIERLLRRMSGCIGVAELDGYRQEWQKL